MSTALAPCAACARHVKVDAARCPFCDASFDAPPSPTAPGWRMSRSALAVFGASLTLAGSGAPTLADADPQDHHVAIPAYGIAPPPAHIDVTVGAPRVTPARRLSPAVVARAMRPLVPRVRSCFTSTSTYVPGGGAALTVTLTSGPAGATVTASAVGYGATDAQRNCVLRQFQSMVLPSHPGVVTITVPVEAHSM